MAALIAQKLKQFHINGFDDIVLTAHAYLRNTIGTREFRLRDISARIH